MTVTLTLDDALVRAARQIAAERNSSPTGLIRDYLEHLVGEEERHALHIQVVRASFTAVHAEPLPRWTRAELHKRH